MQRRINKRLSSALRGNRRDPRDELDEEAGEVEEEEEVEEPPKRSRSRTSTPSGRKETPPSSSKTKASTEQQRPSSKKSLRVSSSREEVEESEEREVTRRPSRSDSRKPSPLSNKTSFGFGEFRNSRLGAAFGTEANQDKQNELEEEEEEELPPTVEDYELPWEEEIEVSPPPGEEITKRKSSRSPSKVDVRRKSSNTGSGSRTSLKDSSRPTKSLSSKKQSSSKESLRRSTSKKSLPPTYYPPVNQPPTFSERPRLSANNVEYFEEIDDDESSLPESSTTSFTRPLGISSSAVRLPPLYDLRQSSGGYNFPRGAASRDVTALPIEIPENVTDEAAFRRYLAVRRGACSFANPTSFSLEEVNANVNSTSYESVGGGAAVGGSKLPAQMALMQQTLLAQLEGNKRTMTLSYAIMTLALLSASATQLRFLVAYSRAHAYSVLNYILVCLCIFIEVFVGLGYVVLSRFTSISEERVDTIHNYLISGLFVVAVANVIIAAFAFDDHVCEVLAKQTELFDSVDQSQQITVT